MATAAELKASVNSHGGLAIRQLCSSSESRPEPGERVKNVKNVEERVGS